MVLLARAAACPLWQSTRLLSVSAVNPAASNDVVVVSAVRTPMGSFMSSLAPLQAHQLGSMAIAEAVRRSGLSPSTIQEVYMGNVLQTNQGQAPARQAALNAGLPNSVPCTTVNKVCASGLKSAMMAAQAILCGHQKIMVAGGMESMSNVPYYMDRGVTPYGGVKLHDGIVKDGLTDAYEHIHMGVCGEKCVTDFGITREQQDEYAISSYERSAAAWKAGVFLDEVMPVTVKSRRSEKLVAEDEEFKNVKFDKLKKLRAVFKKETLVHMHDLGYPSMAAGTKLGVSRIFMSTEGQLFTASQEGQFFYSVVVEMNMYMNIKAPLHGFFVTTPTTHGKFNKSNGTITAGNASTLNDGAAAVVLMSSAEATTRGLQPLARIVAFGDAACAPIDFPVAPALAMPKVLEMAGLQTKDIDQWEINEAFSVVALANIVKLKLDHKLVNPHGGAVSLGHPIGMSGARLLVHLAHTLGKGQRGMIGICNGGGGAAAMLVEGM